MLLVFNLLARIDHARRCVFVEKAAVDFPPLSLCLLLLA